MPLTRILVLQSVEDAITHRRKQRIQQDPRLSQYVFEHCYAIELSDEQKRMPIPFMMSQIFRQSIDQPALAERLTHRIRTFVPEVVIVFYGGILAHFAPEVMHVLQTLKVQFPDLPFGIAHPQYAPSDIPWFEQVFDQTDWLQRLVEQIFPLDRSILGPSKFSEN